MSAISVHDVRKIYGQGRSGVLALERTSLEVQDGEFVAIVGPSGCGKSTLLRMVAGLLAPTSGQITVGTEVVRGPHRVGMVFQTPAMLPWKTALGNVLAAPDLAGLPVREHRDRAMELLEMVGLGAFVDRRPGELSGGMQQRLALCRALVHDPDILLMDEPFGALDAMTRDEMNLELLRVWASGATQKTILFVTHSIPEAVFLADRIVVMSARPGRITEIQDSALARPRTNAMKASEAFGAQTVRIFEQLHGGRSSPRGSAVMLE